MFLISLFISPGKSLLFFRFIFVRNETPYMVEQTAKRKVFFFSFLVGRPPFHCLEYSNEVKFKKQQMRRKKKKKTEIQINKEPKLRIKSEITVIIFAVDKGKARL